MAVVPSDLPVQWSMEFETLFLAEFNQTVSVDRARLDPDGDGDPAARPPGEQGDPGLAGGRAADAAVEG